MLLRGKIYISVPATELGTILVKFDGLHDGQTRFIYEFIDPLTEKSMEISEKQRDLLVDYMTKIFNAAGS